MTTAPNKTNEKNVQIGVKFFEDDSLSRINKSDKVAYLKEQGLSADQINIAFERYQKKRQLLLMHEKGLQEVAQSQKVYDQEITMRLGQVNAKNQAKK